MTLRKGQHGPLDAARRDAETDATITGIVSASRTESLLGFANLFEEFRARSWDGWRGVLARLTEDVREFYAIVGRGAGKSRVVALLAAFFASREYRRVPGESIYVGIFGPDRKQAGITFRYIRGLLKSVPALAALIVSESRDSLELSNGVVVEVLTASKAAPRARAYALAIVEEAAFLPTDESANPDVELLRALRPALARVPGSLLAVVSSPYARRGVLWTAWQKYHDQPDGNVVLVQATTLELNPTFDAGAITRAFEDDPASASAEYDAQFRSDVETFVGPDVIDQITVPGRVELPPVAGIACRAGFDAAGGSGGDSITLAIGHDDERGIGILDALREIRPPFSPEAAVVEFADLLQRYGVTSVQGDRFAGEWPREQFQKRGIAYEVCPFAKSDLYKALLPRLNSGQVELLDHPKLRAQLTGLERRTARGGRDVIDHAPGRHDDLVNAAAIVLTQRPPAKLAIFEAGTSLDHYVEQDGRPARLLSVDELQERADRELAEKMREAARDMVDRIARGGGCWFPGD